LYVDAGSNGSGAHPTQNQGANFVLQNVLIKWFLQSQFTNPST
jgi:hypothetical protein